MTELSNLINSGLRVRRKLLRSVRSRVDLRDLLPKVEYWVACSQDIEETAKKRRVEILMCLPPCFVKKFNEMTL